MNSPEQLRHAQQVMREAESAWRADISSSDLRLRYVAAEKELLIAERLVAAVESLPHAICRYARLDACFHIC